MKPVLFCLFIVSFICGGMPVWASDYEDLVINEVVAKNGSGAVDPQGETEDWIEIYNSGSQSLDLAGLYLSDNPDNPLKWQFPLEDSALTTIPAQGYLVIWADKDVNDGLHANFSLDADGETLVLYHWDGVTLLDAFAYDRLPLDTSFGLSAEGDLAYLSEPTPGAQNAAALAGLVEDPEFSHTRGFYQEGFPQVLTCATSGTTIYYTLDGSDPTSESSEYTEPLTIMSTNCLRAIAVKSGWKSSSVVTHTFLFVADIKNQSSEGEPAASPWPTEQTISGHVIDYGMDPDVVNDSEYKDMIEDALLDIPSISFVTDLDNFFDPDTGVYVNADLSRSADDSSAWERPVSVELIHPDGSSGFQIGAGLRLRGGTSQKGENPKHGFRLYFRTQYGQGKLEYPLFGDEGTDEFDKIDLRTSQQISWTYEDLGEHNTLIRDVFSRDLQGEMGQPYTRSRYYHLYINGQYWGVFQSQERPEAAFAASYMGGDKDDYDAIKVDYQNGKRMLPTDGNRDAFRQLWDLTIAGFDDQDRYLQAQGLNPDGSPNPDYPKLLDVNNLIDFMVIEYYTGDKDGPGSRWVKINNLFCVYNRENPDGFKWFQHDSEWSLGHTIPVKDDGIGVENLVVPFTTDGEEFDYFTCHWLHEQIIENNSDYRMQFADRVYSYFREGGLLSPEANIQRVECRAEELELAIVAESARWGDFKTSSPRTCEDDWRPAVEYMINDYFPWRTEQVLEQFKDVGWYPEVDPPTIDQVDDVLSLSGTGDIYYTLDGSDPRLSDINETTVTTTLVTADAAKRVLVPTGDIGDDWRADLDYDDQDWLNSSGLPGGVGYELRTDYEDLISLDLLDMMFAYQSGCYLRIPFEISEDPNGFDTLVLKMQYDDGFVAYLNGTEIQRVGYSVTTTRLGYRDQLEWDSQADSDHEAESIESFDVSEFLGLLTSGENFLAIHGLNASSTSSDFVIWAELVAQQVTQEDENSGIATGSILYSTPIVMEENLHIKARCLSDSTWSALEDQTFLLGPVSSGLTVTEIMYHAQGDGDPDLDFIELMNIGDETLNLKDVSFTDGITYTFESFDLSSGEFVVLARNPTAFAAHYGHDIFVVGPYDGQLSNKGECLTLTAPDGEVILSFEYEDQWYPLTDGEGYSLVRLTPSLADEDLSDADAWGISQEIGGSPGQVDEASLGE